MENENFNNQLQRAVYHANPEKTSQDQILSKQEVLRLRELVGKDVLKQLDINSIQNILVSNEIKMTNFTDREKYIIGKYFIWVSEYAKRYTKSISAKEFYTKYDGKLTERTKEARLEIEKDYANTYKLLVHVYCYLIRSPLSVKGALINRFTTNRQEIQYSGQLPGQPAAGQPNTQWRQSV